MLARFLLLFTVWLTGLLIYSIDGLMRAYLLNPQIYMMLFIIGFIILFGTYMWQPELDELFKNVRQMLKMNDSNFKKFSNRVKRYCNSIIPGLIFAVVFVILLTSVPEDFQLALDQGFELHIIWNISYNFFVYLLVGTSIWMFISIWVIIFLVSRQPLSVKLSKETIKKFRALSMLALYFSIGYFFGLSLGIIFVSITTGTVTLNPLEAITAPFLFFIAIGIIGVLLPFYNIHKTILKIKKQELLKIDEESERLLQQLDDVLAKKKTKQTNDRTIAIMARLYSLRLKENRVKGAQDWPIDIGFISKIIGLGLMPIIIMDALLIASEFLNINI